MTRIDVSVCFCDFPSFRWVRNIQIGLFGHAPSVSVSCESLVVGSGAAESVHIVCT